ncbi:MAG TPA: hypothetical protein VKX17_00360 [Planctomycetota bacterium]|nr:hypothetical protein [Planctomycetota bacterium]
MMYPGRPLFYTESLAGSDAEGVEQFSMTTCSESSLSFNADEVSAAFDSLIARLSKLATQEPTPQSVALLRSLITEFERYDEAELADTSGLRGSSPCPGTGT